MADFEKVYRIDFDTSKAETNISQFMKLIGRLEKRIAKTVQNPQLKNAVADIGKATKKSSRAATSALSNTTTAALKFRQALNKTQTSTKKLSKAGDSLGKLMTAANRRAESGQNRVTRAVDATRKQVEKTDKALSKANSGLSSTTATAIRLRQAFEKANAKITATGGKPVTALNKTRAATKKLTDAGKSLDKLMAAANRKAISGQKQVARAVDATRKQVERTDKALSKAMRARGNKAAAGIRRIGSAAKSSSVSIGGLVAKLSLLVGAAAGIRNVISEYLDFDQAVTSAAAKFSKKEPDLIPGTKAFKKFRTEIRKTGLDTEHSAEGVARALDFWAKAGQSSSQAKAVIPVTLDFASANQDAAGAALDVAKAGDILSDALGQFQLAAEDPAELMANTQRVADVMSAAANTANVSAEELFESFKKGGPAMTSVGKDIEETASLLAAMANAGIKGSMAGRQLNIALSALNSATPKQEKLLRKLGVRVADSEGNFRGLTSIIGDLNKTTADMGTSERFDVFSTLIGREGSSAFISLLAEGQAELDKTTAALRDAGGETKRLAGIMRQSGEAQWKGFKKQIKDLGFGIIEQTGLFGKLGAAIKTVDWAAAAEFISDDVVPALMTLGRTLTNVVWPALKRAGQIVNTVLQPALKIAARLFGDVSQGGDTLVEVLGILGAAWVAYRAYLMAVKATEMVGWFVDLIRQITQAGAAQAALNTQSAATNATLGQGVKQFGALRTAGAVFAAFVAGWEIGTIIHDTLVEPLAKANFELERLKAEIEDTQKKDLSKRSVGLLESDKETAEKAAKLEQKAQSTLDTTMMLTGMGGMGGMGGGLGLGPARVKEAEKIETFRQNVEEQLIVKRQEENIKRFETVETGTSLPEKFGYGPGIEIPELAFEAGVGKSVDTDLQAFISAVEEIAETKSLERDWTLEEPGSPGSILKATDDVQMPLVITQQEILKSQEQKRAEDRAYQQQMLAKQSDKKAPVVNQKVEIGPTNVTIKVASGDPTAIARELKNVIRSEDRTRSQQANDMLKSIGPTSI